MLKTGLNIARFKEHVKVIEAETIEYFQRWGDSGERSKILDISLDQNSSSLFLVTLTLKFCGLCKVAKMAQLIA